MERKQFLRYMGAGLGWVAIAPLLTACGGDDDSTTTPDTTVPPATPDTTLPPAASTLSAEEIAGLKFMREEEKLAHDVYIALYALFGNDDIFYRISLSETAHTETIRALLVKYGIPDPAAGNPAGVFTDPALQSLYDTLIAMGSASRIAALKVGALIEETDIRDIKEKIAVTDEADILTAYNNLLCGSQDHLRAFYGQLLASGVIYVPQVITPAQLNAIVGAPQGTCVPV